MRARATIAQLRRSRPRWHTRLIACPTWTRPTSCATLTRQLRAQLARHAAAGTWAAPGGPAARGRAERCAGRRDRSTRRSTAPAGARSPQIRAELGECTRCKLHSTRRSIVFGVGDRRRAADVRRRGAGRAGGQARRAVRRARRRAARQDDRGDGLDARRRVYITNILMCRPPGNRNPQPDEVAQCKPFLDAQIARDRAAHHRRARPAGGEHAARHRRADQRAARQVPRSPRRAR